MTQAGSTAEMTYQRLKAALQDGAIDRHARLDIARLAAQYDVSPTPVREAAMRLLGEGLLELHPGGGTRPVPISEFRLRMLIELHGRMIDMALGWADHIVSFAYLREAATIRNPHRRFFGEIARNTDNVDLIMIIERLSDRLAPFRQIEGEIFANLAEEWEGLRLTAIDGTARGLRKAIRTYHRRRLAHVAQLVWHAARNQLDAIGR